MQCETCCHHINLSVHTPYQPVRTFGAGRLGLQAKNRVVPEALGQGGFSCPDSRAFRWSLTLGAQAGAQGARDPNLTRRSRFAPRRETGWLSTRSPRTEQLGAIARESTRPAAYRAANFRLKARRHFCRPDVGGSTPHRPTGSASVGAPTDALSQMLYKDMPVGLRTRRRLPASAGKRLAPGRQHASQKHCEAHGRNARLHTLAGQR